ncbi:MAG: hypothetical protein DRN81_03500 [Thermoproteota archaeon]|nr:MAG: hypothetical protein DRN81_03500 [Candidatus Korarchaeota archaeon]
MKLLEKFEEWREATKHCPMRFQTRPFNVCLYNGQPCCFEKCPRRAYEENLRVEMENERRISELSQEVRELKETVGRLQRLLEEIYEVASSVEDS